MGKILLSVLLLMVSWSLQAQGPSEEAKLKIGLKGGMAIASNRVQLDSDSLNLATNGAGLRFSFGPVFDIPISNNNNYYFHTGLVYAAKRAGIQVTDKDDLETREEVYSVQYLQVPVALKLYTNEVALDTKIYFNVGTQLEVNINERSKENSNIYIEGFRPVDVSIQLGAGTEFRAGVNTSFFAGFSYTRGLIDAVSDQLPLDDNLVLKNDLFSIDFGIKF